MSEIRIGSDSIIVKSEYFDAKDTLECGQLFRYKLLRDGAYEVLSCDKRCLIKTDGGITTIKTNELDYFYRYFDLDTDYGALTLDLQKYDELKQPLNKSKGIHILKQDLFETVISFIISANNNIPRIQGIIERLCEGYGQRMDGFYAFPALSSLKDVTASDFKSMGAGYRAEYLRHSVLALLDSDLLITLPKQDYDGAVRALLTLKGVGRKVADCIALFGLGLTECYPVDTWILQADGIDGDTADSVRKRGMERYGRLAGFAQQYRFYWKRGLG